jgi:hypothetical protein
MPEPSREFWERVLTQDLRRADQVTHAIDMLAALPGEMATATSAVLYVACMEDFLVHARALIEFLHVHSPNRRLDFTAEDFGWTPPPDLVKSPRLEAVWTAASQNLVHFSKERAPASVYNIRRFDTSVENLRSIATEILDLFAVFVNDLEARQHSEAASFRHSLDEAISELSETAG